MNTERLINLAPIIISTLALLVSGISLGWNIFRDVILKPRLKITISNTMAIVGLRKAGDYLAINVANSGPGTIKIKKFTVKQKGALFPHTPKNTFLMTDPNNPYSEKLPAVIEVGTDAVFLLPWNERAMFPDKPETVNIGAIDVYDRVHWADRSSFRVTKKAWHQQFETQNTHGTIK